MNVQSIFLSGACIAILAATGIAEAASLRKADAQFLTMAAKSDMTEAHEGEIAVNQAARTDVKAFARTIVQDHTDSYHELTALAAKTGVSIPRGINVARDQTIVQLVHLKGAGFDREFVRDQIATHRHAIAVFKQEAEHGQDAGVKAYAARMVPILEKHLHLAEDCAKPGRRS
jgi:putative membrane protein